MSVRNVKNTLTISQKVMKDLKGMKAKLRELIGSEADEYTVYEGIAEEVKEPEVVNTVKGNGLEGRPM